MNMLDNKTVSPSRGAAQHLAARHRGHAMPTTSIKKKGVPSNNFGKNKGNTTGRGKC